MSVLLAEAIAEKLGAAFCNVIAADVVKKGASSPKKSAALPPFKFSGALLGPVLVVDDVATSGRHMELAQMALRVYGVPVLGMVWIGPS